MAKNLIGTPVLFDPKEFLDLERQNARGFEPDPGRPAPGPTRTTSEPWTETPQRKPYMPVEDTSIPSLEDGVSFRQTLHCGRR